MNATTESHPRKTDLTVTHVLAELLERLDVSLAAERQAKEVLDRAMRQAMNRSKTPPKEDPTHGKS